jgi:hypothetical protein
VDTPASPPRCSPGQGSLGPKPKPGGAPAFPRVRTGRKVIAGRLISLGRPVSNKKNEFFVFLLLFENGNGLENV